MIYFVSDTHLGLAYQGMPAREREQRLVEWLCTIAPSCEQLFLVGDIFDYWFEYTRVIPKGFSRLFGQLAAMADSGIPIHFFAGNHDMWLGDYFTKEFGAMVYTEPTLFELQGRQVMIAHGDGLGKTDAAGRLLSSLFRSRSARWLFQHLVHPDASMRFGQWWSSGNRHKRGNVTHTFRGEDEPVVRWAQQTLTKQAPIDYFIFGHLHTPTIFEIQNGTKIVVLGQWIEHPVAAAMSGGEVRLVQV